MAAENLKTRIFNFAVNVARLVQQLPYDNINRHYFNQLIRCSSSVGANYRASQRAKSDADFLNKLKIVEEEADESIFFLELLLALNPQHSSLIHLMIAEGTEILRIVVASINTVRQKISELPMIIPAFIRFIIRSLPLISKDLLISHLIAYLIS